MIELILNTDGRCIFLHDGYIKITDRTSIVMQTLFISYQLFIMHFVFEIIGNLSSKKF